MNTSCEHLEQVALFQWARKNLSVHPELDAMFAVPNGGARNPITAKRLKAEGVKAGVPDIFLMAARGGYHGMVIELKRVGGGRLTAEQCRWLAMLGDEGYLAVVCHGWVEAKDHIIQYLGGNP